MRLLVHATTTTPPAAAPDGSDVLSDGGSDGSDGGRINHYGRGREQRRRDIRYTWEFAADYCTAAASSYLW
jgi:hypothetical protein